MQPMLPDRWSSSGNVFLVRYRYKKEGLPQCNLFLKHGFLSKVVF